ncbi:MAG: hypothetical protein BZY87_05025 [SAR202 cluster bacterium Io17-Chloro-G6]|nr:MAG: hypothetical protein BZY87_05025 [SAR202 cluster bacterium Io17-Chloro-G6]
MLMLVVGLMVSGGVVTAGDVSCGDTLTTDTTLHEDLTCITTPGLIIGADDITVDLNGHTITGAACGFCHGIRNGDSDADDPFQAGTSSGFSDVTIKNGTVEGFEQGIRGWEVSGFTIKDMVVKDQTSSNAIDILHSSDVRIKDTTVTIGIGLAPEAIRLENVDGATVKNVDVDGGSVGVNFGCAPCNTGEQTNGVIIDSSFANNGNGILLASTTDAMVRRNTVTDSAGSSILVGLSFLNGVFGFPADAFPAITGVKLFDNTVVDSGSNGILLVQTSGSNLFGNTITGSAGRGIWLINGSSLIGASVSGDSTGNNLFRNTATGNGGNDMEHDAGSTPNKWKKNTCVTSSGADIDCP